MIIPALLLLLLPPSLSLPHLFLLQIPPYPQGYLSPFTFKKQTDSIYTKKVEDLGPLPPLLRSFLKLAESFPGFEAERIDYINDVLEILKTHLPGGRVPVSLQEHDEIISRLNFEFLNFEQRMEIRFLNLKEGGEEKMRGEGKNREFKNLLEQNVFLLSVFGSLEWTLVVCLRSESEWIVEQKKLEKAFLEEVMAMEKVVSDSETGSVEAGLRFVEEEEGGSSSEGSREEKTLSSSLFGEKFDEKVAKLTEEWLEKLGEKGKRTAASLRHSSVARTRSSYEVLPDEPSSSSPSPLPPCGKEKKRLKAYFPSFSTSFVRDCKIKNFKGFGKKVVSSLACFSENSRRKRKVKKEEERRAREEREKEKGGVDEKSEGRMQTRRVSLEDLVRIGRGKYKKFKWETVWTMVSTVFSYNFGMNTQAEDSYLRVKTMKMTTFLSKMRRFLKIFLEGHLWNENNIPSLAFLLPLLDFLVFRFEDFLVFEGIPGEEMKTNVFISEPPTSLFGSFPRFFGASDIGRFLVEKVEKVKEKSELLVSGIRNDPQASSLVPSALYLIEVCEKVLGFWRVLKSASTSAPQARITFLRLREAVLQISTFLFSSFSSEKSTCFGKVGFSIPFFKIFGSWYLGRMEGGREVVSLWRRADENLYERTREALGGEEETEEGEGRGEERDEMWDVILD